jgi:septum formation protein
MNSCIHLAHGSIHWKIIMKIILASSSPYRKSLLEDVGLHVDAIGANVDEYALIGVSPVDTAIQRARAKAQNVFSRDSSHVVIGADQVCYLDDEILDKPKSAEEWLGRLKRMVGRTHHLSTAVCIEVPEGISARRRIEFVETTIIHFRSDLGDDSLQRYVDIGEAKGCAGGYMMERRGAWLIEKIEGDWQNVIGLPIFPLLTELRALGCPIFG